MAEGDVNVSDLTKMKVADLKRELKARGLSIVGNKNDLIERLQGGGSTLESGGGGGTDENDANNTTVDGDVMDESGNAEDAELLDEDDVLEDGLDDEFSVEGISETNDSSTGLTPAANPESLETLNSANPVQQTKPTTKRKLMSSKKTEPSGHQPPKKITLNRNTSLSAAASEKENQESRNEEKSSTKDESNDETNGSPPNKKVIKLSGFSVKERLELRAQKFGPLVSESVKREARAVRFGIAGSQTASSVPVASAEVLKKRAERFGTTVSPISKKTELDEKLKLRQQRFGTTPAEGNNVLSAQAKAGLEEKKRLRAERFKITMTT